MSTEADLGACRCDLAAPTGAVAIGAAKNGTPYRSWYRNMRYAAAFGRLKSLVRADRYTQRPPVPLLVAAVTAVLVAVGSTGPWARVLGETYVNDEIEVFSVRGTVGDGMATLALGILAGVLILWRLVRTHSSGFVLGAAIVVLVVVVVVGMLNWLDVSHMPGVSEPGRYFRTGARAAWGLIVVTLAASAGVSALAYQLWNDELR